MAHDDQFTALGPSLVGSGFPRAAFSTSASDMVHGVNVSAELCGVYGETYHSDSDHEPPVNGIGVFGVGGNFGVFGGIWRTTPAGAAANLHLKIAGVRGQNNDGGIGVIGAAMARPGRDGTGIVGASLSSLGNPLQPIPDPATGPGIGVLGTSGEGPGVQGKSATGPGVQGNSLEADGGQFSSGVGVGVRGSSEEGRGGFFESGVTRAQIHLAPKQQDSLPPRLPKSGKVGDIIIIRTTGIDAEGRAFDQCMMWVCTPREPFVEESDQWRPVTLGTAVTGVL